MKQNAPPALTDRASVKNNYSEFTSMTATNATPSGTIHKLLYTHNRAAQILQARGIKVKRVEKISINRPSGEYYRCVQVTYIVSNGSRCSTFVSCRDFLALATQGRRERSKDYKAYQDSKHPSQWKVYANVVQLPTENRQPTRGSEGKVRHVVCDTTGVSCDCEDYLNQPDYLQEHPYLWWVLCKQRHICKHTINVMSALGFNSFRDYLAGWLPNGRLSRLAGVMNRRGGTYYTSNTMSRTA